MGRQDSVGPFAVGLACLFVFSASAGAALAQGFVPGPGEARYDAALAAKALRYDRQFRAINAYQNGLSLDAHYRPEHRDLITQFIQSGSGEDFKAATGTHVYDVLYEYGEHGDLGMFGGVATAGDAYAYMVLRDSGAPAADVQKARAALLRNLDAWHVYTDITGGQGLVARGIMLTSGPNPGDPAVPGGVPQTTPVPSQCNTLPKDKHAMWRADLSGHHGNYIWYDECSKDQYDGYAFALGVMWDAISGDTDIPQSYRDRIRDDALKNARALMKKNQVKSNLLPYELDMVIMDPDGCATRWYGLNARVLDEGTPIITSESASTQNGFNGLLGMGAVRVFHHITGDPDVGAFYYDELVGRRDWLKHVDSSLMKSVLYAGTNTNCSNVNMGMVGLFNVLRYEGDKTLRARWQDLLERIFYNPGDRHAPKGTKQTFFDFIYASQKAGGTSAQAVADGLETLREWPDAPYFNDAVENCDAAEVQSKQCVGIDGTPITIETTGGRSCDVCAYDPVPRRIRPPSNFEWRSSPFDANGGGGNRLNPGGDFRGSYWMGRYFKTSPDNLDTLSPFARDRSNNVVGPGHDGGTEDRGTTDDGTMDAGAVDTGADGGALDTGGDGGTLDAGWLDAGGEVGMLDAGGDGATPDTGWLDAGRDEGMADAGTEPPDASDLSDRSDQPDQSEPADSGAGTQPRGQDGTAPHVDTGAGESAGGCSCTSAGVR